MLFYRILSQSVSEGGNKHVFQGLVQVGFIPEKSPMQIFSSLLDQKISGNGRP